MVIPTSAAGVGVVAVLVVGIMLVAVAGLLLASFIERAALLDAGVVGLPFQLCVWWEGEDAFHGFPVGVSIFAERKTVGL